MINRFAGLTPTRSRAVVHDDLVFTVAVAPDPVSPSMYEQSVKALARLDEGEQRIRRCSAIAEEAGARLPSDADGLMPLQRIDVIETHLTPPRLVRRLSAPARSFDWVASTQSV